MILIEKILMKKIRYWIFLIWELESSQNFPKFNSPNIRNVCFLDFASSLPKKILFHWKVKAFLSFGLGRSISRITKKIFGAGLFHFLSLENSVLKAFNLEAREFRFPKYKKNIFFKKLWEIFSEWHFFIF